MFGFKAFAAEKIPFSHKAKGFRERTIQMLCSFGLPEHDIQEIVNDADDPKHKALLSELSDLRNRLLIYRLVHCHDPIPDINVDLQAREKQLWKPLLRVFQSGPKTFEILKKVVLEYVNEYREQKSHTHTAFLVRMISELVKEKETLTFATADIWERYKQQLPEGESIGKTSYTSPEYGEMSQKKLNQLLQDQFKARPPKHHGDKRQLVFEKTALERMERKYRINVKDIDSGTDGTDGTDGTHVGLDRHMPKEDSDTNISKNAKENTNNSSKNEQKDTNRTQQNADQGSIISDNASHVSQTDDRSKKNDPDAHWAKGKWRENIQQEEKHK